MASANKTDQQKRGSDMHGNDRLDSPDIAEHGPKNCLCEQGILRPLLRILPQAEPHSTDAAHPEEITVALFELQSGTVRATPLRIRSRIHSSVLAGDRNGESTVDGDY